VTACPLPAPGAQRRRLGLAAAAAGAAIAMPAFIGCSRTPAQQPIRFWAMGREGEVLDELLAPLRREAPALRWRIERIPWSAAHEKLLTAFAGDATPDIAQLGNTWIAEMAAIGALQPLDRRAEAEGLRAADHFSGIWQTNRIDGTLWGLPWYVDTRLLFYRRDLFERAGVTTMPVDWAGFVNALDALQKSGVRSPLLLPLAEPEPLLALALQQPEPLLRASNARCRFISSASPKATRHTSPTARSPTCGRSSAAAALRRSSRGHGTSASSTGGYPHR
jgi:multiple sugar transport system substrate-binding protein